MTAPRWLLAAVLVVCAPSPAQAQKHRLTDEDIPRAIAALRAQIAAIQNVTDAFAGASATADRQLEAAAEIRSGRLDAWAYLRQQVPLAAVPPGALHDARCSMQATGETPVAAFSFGESEALGIVGSRVDLTEEGRKIYEAMRAYAESQGPVTPERDEELRGMAQAQADRNVARNPGSRNAQGMSAARAFYEDAGFTAVTETSLRHPSEPSLTVLLNALPPASCPASAAPMVLLVHSPAVTAVAAAADRPAKTPAEIAAASGWTESELSEVITSVLTARADLDRPQYVQLASPAEADVRRANMAVYQRHAAALDPLMEAMRQIR